MTATADLEVVAGNVERFPAEAVRHVVTGLRDAILPRARRDTGGDLILSNWRPRAQLAITATIDAGTDVVHGAVLPGPRRVLGAWRALDDGTRPRVQGSGHNPGTKPKRTLAAAVERATPDLVREVESEWQEVTR